MTAVDEALAALLPRLVDDLEAVVSIERLTGGASQETYAIELDCRGGRRRLALRRSPGGVERSGGYDGPGLATEAQLMTVARAAGVPEPAVLHVLGPADGLGEGFLMNWVEGETLGARIARHEDFAGVRPRLARQ
ncbi:MAG: phosphotransferase family protein, partial [Gammaproteobacteria bacterium]